MRISGGLRRRARPRRFPHPVHRLGALCAAAAAFALAAASRSLAAIDRNRRKTVSALLLMVIGALFWTSLPDPLFRSPYGTVVEARDGRLLGARIAADGQWRFPEAPCPDRFARAAMAYEDSRFPWHPGIDPLAILRATADNARSGKVRSGASTLTMQVVRLSRPGSPRTLWQKAVEALLALRLELAYDKREILTLYASHAPFGGNVVGLPAASWRYFGRGPESLSWGEAALLAVLPNSPALMHPGRNRDPLRRKRDRLLTRLWHKGIIDSLTSALARLEPLPEKPRPLPRHAPHLLQTLASGRLGLPAGSPFPISAADYPAPMTNPRSASIDADAASIEPDVTPPAANAAATHLHAIETHLQETGFGTYGPATGARYTGRAIRANLRAATESFHMRAATFADSGPAMSSIPGRSTTVAGPRGAGGSIPGRSSTVAGPRGAGGSIPGRSSTVADFRGATDFIPRCSSTVADPWAAPGSIIRRAVNVAEHWARPGSINPGAAIVAGRVPTGLFNSGAAMVTGHPIATGSFNPAFATGSHRRAPTLFGPPWASTVIKQIPAGYGHSATSAEAKPAASTKSLGRRSPESSVFSGIFASATNSLGRARQAPPSPRSFSFDQDHQPGDPGDPGDPSERSERSEHSEHSEHSQHSQHSQSNQSRASHEPLRPGQASRFRTTLDYDLQIQVGDILGRRQRQWEAMGIGNAAVLVLHTPTGEVLAYCGNLMAGDSAWGGRQVDIVTARRSTGSLLKPFLYAAMLEAGEILPGTLVPDVPTHIAGFTPENFDRAFEGAVPARMALARSLNVPAVRMLREHGIERFLHTLRDLGLESADRSAGDYGLTLVLGGSEGTLWELTGMYAGLAREARRYAHPAEDNGTRRTFFPPRVRSSGAAAGGLPVAAAAGDPDSWSAPATGPGADPGAHPPSHPGHIGPAAAWFALQAMAEVSRPDAERHWRSFASSRWVAWKTGTSFGFRDAWAVGVTPEFTVGVWVGNAGGEGRPGMTGIQAAAPVLFETFNLLPATTEFAKPMASLVRIPVCARSGMRPSPHCPPGDSAYVPAAGLRTAACPYHRLVHLDAGGSRQVHDGCESVSAMRHEPWFVLPPTQEWYYRRRHGDYLPLPPWRGDCAAGAAALRQKAMDLLYPRAGARIYVPIELDARKGRTVFEAVHREPGATVFWHLDENYLGQTREFHKWAVDPPPGRHVLLLVDDRGERLEQAFDVMAREEAVTDRGAAGR